MSSRSLELCLLAVLLLAGCERERRAFKDTLPSNPALITVTQTTLHAGPVNQPVTVESPYEENAYAVSEGKRLFNQYNCSGCHFQGGGGIGPPLMDNEWIYGSEPENIYETIVEGRPNGMPAFGGKLSNQQVWQLVAYVRSMSGLLRKDVAPGRDDHMQVTAQEQQTQKAKPKPSSQPPSTTQP
jgi:cytochrome c oxidase cbb3-type subunit 3